MTQPDPTMDKVYEDIQKGVKELQRQEAEKKDKGDGGK
jgi:hypothetical protein